MGGIRTVAVALFLGLTGAGETQAQLLPGFPLLLEARLGGAVPTGDFGSRDAGIGAETGLALGLGGAVDLFRGFGVYAAYRLERFGCGECVEVNLEGSTVSSGVEAGGQMLVPYERFGLRPWLRAGLLRQVLELEGEGGEIASEPGLGFAVGAGVRAPVAGVLLSPGIHYRSYPAEFELGAFPSRSVDVTQLTFELGVAVRF